MRCEERCCEVASLRSDLGNGSGVGALTTETVFNSCSITGEIGHINVCSQVIARDSGRETSCY